MMGMEPSQKHRNSNAGKFIREMEGIFKETKVALKKTTEKMKRKI